jgi:hypothetical protein
VSTNAIKATTLKLIPPKVFLPTYVLNVTPLALNVLILILMIIVLNVNKDYFFSKTPLLKSQESVKTFVLTVSFLNKKTAYRVIQTAPLVLKRANFLA